MSTAPWIAGLRARRDTGAAGIGNANASVIMKGVE